MVLVAQIDGATVHHSRWGSTKQVGLGGDPLAASRTAKSRWSQALHLMLPIGSGGRYYRHRAQRGKGRSPRHGAGRRLDVAALPSAGHLPELGSRHPGRGAGSGVFLSQNEFRTLLVLFWARISVCDLLRPLKSRQVTRTVANRLTTEVRR